MSSAVVNGNAIGVWSARVGSTLEIVRSGSNERHVLVRRPGERHVFGFPASWLDREIAPPAPAAPDLDDGRLFREGSE